MAERKKNYRDLLVWQRGMDLVVEIYRLTARLPATEQFGLIAQMRRAVISVPSNMAEGQARSSRKEFLRYLLISRGLLAEAETQLLAAMRLEFLSRQAIRPAWNLIQEVARLLNGLIHSLRKAPGLAPWTASN